MKKADGFWNLVGAFSGIVAIILSLVGSTFIGSTGDELSPDSPGEAIAREFISRSPGVTTGVYLNLLSGFFLLIFIGYFRQHLQKAEGGHGWLTSVAFGGGLVAGAIAALRASYDLASAVVSASDPEVAKALVVLTFRVDFVWFPATAALVGAASLITLRYGALPKWIGWLGAVVVLLILALPPVAPGLGAIVGFLWLFPVSVVLVWRAIRSVRY